jgi:hypothetical protein
MKLILKLLIVGFLGLVVYACCEDDETLPDLNPARDRTEQYARDKDSILKFMDNHYIDDVLTSDGRYEAVIKRISAANPLPVGKQKMKDDPRKRSVIIKNDERDFRALPPTLIGDDVPGYEVFYFNLKEGDVAINNHTSDYEKTAHVTDSVFVNYKGWNANYKLPNPIPAGYSWQPPVFDKVASPVWLNLRTVVSGFRQILPYIKAGEYDVSSPNQSIPFNNFGSFIVLIPSGLGYFNSALGANIQPYSNLVFQISLMRIKRSDWDNDGIPNIFEFNHTDFSAPKILDAQNFVIDLYAYNSNGINPNNNPNITTNTIPNLLDQDDDGDAILTRREIRRKYDLINCSLPKWYINGVFQNVYNLLPNDNSNLVKAHLSSFRNNFNMQGECP